MVPGFVLLRLRGHRLLLAAALLSVMLTTCAVAALAAFGDAVGDAGLRRALQGPSAAKALIDVKADVSGDDTRQVDAHVREAVTKAYDGLPVHVLSSTRSAAYGLPASLRPSGAPRSGEPDLTLLATFDRSRVTLVEGTFPGVPRTGTPVPVALPETAARTLGLRPGAEVTLADRLGGPPLRVRLTGLYRPIDPNALYWRLDPLAGRGVRTLSFTTYGPLLVDPRAFAAGVVAPAEIEWTAGADFSAMTTARIDRLGQDVRRTVTRLGASESGTSVSASSELPDLLADVKGALLVSRSTLLISALQLVLLAALSLLLVSGLLAGERSGETAQLRARGGSRTGVAALSAVEALLLVAPAAVVAPLLAGWLVRLLAGNGALARAGVRLEPSSATAWWTAALTALACALIVVAPALRRSGTYTREHAASARQRALPAALQAGGDLSLVVLASLAYWQLSRREAGTGVLSSDTTGKLGLDPVLVAAPALCLLAGAVVALRLLPLAARLGERRASRSRGLYASLVGWQLSRRPGRGAGPALLLVFAVSISMFAIAEDTSWSRSQRDQADFAVGSDVRVDGSATPPFGQGGVYDRIPGVAAVTPAGRSTVSLPQDRNATLLAMDAPAAAHVMRLRDDLSTTSVKGLTRPLRTDDEAEAAKEGFALSADAARLRVTVRVQASGPGSHEGRGKVADDLYATVVDRHGVPYTFALGRVPSDGRVHTLEADFAAEAGKAAGAAPAGPLRVTSFKARYLLPLRNERHRLTITSVAAVTADGTARSAPTPTSAIWTAQAAIANPDFPYDPDNGYLPSSTQSPRSDKRAPLTVGYETGAEPYQRFVPNGADEASLTLRAGPPPSQVLPAVATDAFLRAVDAGVGASVPVEVAGAELTVRITGAVRVLPTTGDGSAGNGGGALVMDLATLDRALSFQDAPPLEPDEWWLATKPGAAGQVVETLRGRGDITSVLVREEARAELGRDPLGAGPLSALPAAVVAAMVLATVGFAVASVGAVRERSAEFAVLRALGTKRRSLARMIAAEQGVLVVVAVAVGAALGEVLTRLIVPLIVLTSGARSPVPAVRVEMPAGPLLPLLAAVVVLPLLAVVLTALRAVDPARALRRQGGE
ncbi:FtsX-like permease family protein [Actinacidiphila glaucinigra]|uniref:FtsX-like permease family protein n=1 Tax=Actinacidiphila glaucinigra TaxID=235986 RepID=UPI002DDA0AF1|nr:FtsX-like permease family protein [Actinacidiphila glaucinigra]WSD58926.1 FtsX-like permease family protein [Actinacidiphila glaucinigra]